MERMEREELEKLKDFKVYVFEGDVYVKAEDYKEKAIENKKLKERINVLYEFIERNDKLVDEVINEEDLDKLNRYIYIDDDLVDRTLESED